MPWQNLQGTSYSYLDRKGTLLYTNRAASQCIGIPSADIVGKRQVDLFPPEMAQAHVERIERVFATGEPMERDGLFHFGPQVVWLRTHLFPIRNEAGQIASVMGVCHNITERKCAEEALGEREAQLLESQEVANLGFNVVDLATGRITTSTVLDRICGIPADYERTLDKWADLVHPDERQEMLDYLKEVIEEKKPFDHEYRIVRYGDRQIRWVHGRGRLQFNEDGQPIAILGTVQDITERKRAEVELAKSKAMLQAAIDCLPFNFFALGLDGRYMLQNAVSKAQQRVDAIGKRPEEVCPNKHDLAIWLDNNRRAFAGEKVEGEVTLSLGGEERFYHNIIAPIRDREELLGILGVNIDITERKRAENALQKAHDELEQRVKVRTAELAKANESLRQSHDELQTIYDNMVDGLLIADCATGQLLRTNPAICRMLGYSKDELLLKSVKDIHPADAASAVLKKFRTQREGQKHITESRPTMRKDGTVFYADISNIRISFQGRPCVIGLFRDITERKQAQEALRASEERFRVTFEEAPVGMVIGVGDGVITKANRALCRISGYSEDELVGRHIRDLTYPEDRELSSPFVKRLMAGEIPSFTLEKRYLRKDGQPFWAQATTAMAHAPDGKIPFALGIVEDITARKQAEEALRASEERYELAVRGAGVGIWDWDILTGKLYYSPRWKAIFGYDDKDIGDSVDDWAELLHPDERDWMLTFLEDFLAGTLPTVTVEYRLRHKDGSYRWIVAHGLVLRDEQGKAYRFVGSHGDITDRKRVEEALAKERQSLWRMLQASDHERQIISYEIHDGLAQYLAAAGMQFQAHDALKENSPGEAKKAYDIAVGLVRQAHAESRRLISEVRPPVIDENGLEMAISHLVHEQRRHGGPKIECHNDVQFKRLPSILENALYRIAQEALTNACKHSKSKKVTVTMTQEDQDVRLEVRDWGIGFDADLVKEGHFGVEGIRQRVRLLGGRLSIESKPNFGTLVQVVVPIVEKQAED